VTRIEDVIEGNFGTIGIALLAGFNQPLGFAQDCGIDEDHILLFRRGVEEVTRHGADSITACQLSIQTGGFCTLYGLPRLPTSGRSFLSEPAAATYASLNTPSQTRADPDSKCRISSMSRTTYSPGRKTRLPARESGLSDTADRSY
jgi:hypothetical protein